MNNAIILVSCPDRKGINARITDFIYRNNGNIEHFDQHIDSQTSTFFMRLEWSLDGFAIPREKIGESFSDIAKEFSMNWQLYFTDIVPNIAIFVSRKTHCLYDLLLRHKSGQLKCNIVLIVSNENVAQEIADSFGIEFVYTPVSDDDRIQQEVRQLDLLRQKNVELVVLARYMRLLTSNFIKHFPSRIINIHHSFLPAFVGYKAYQQAYRRGVKIIGATAHYVTEQLDAGPIIEQDIIRVNHRDSLSDMVTKGEDLEKLVLYRAVKWYLERKLLVYNNKTVVFD